MRKVCRYGLSISLLVLIDQCIKLFIDRYWFNSTFTIINNLLRFRPIINVNLSWGGNYFAFLSNPWVANILNIIVIIIVLVSFYHYKQTLNKYEPWATIVFVLLMAGSICSLIDKLFWGGSLDFIQIPLFFTFDLKDCYLSLAVLIFVFLSMYHERCKR